MFATLRRIVCPAIVLFLFISATHNVFGQTYTPTPDGVTAGVAQNFPGTSTNSSGSTGGLPSVTATGTVTVSFDLQATFTVYGVTGKRSTAAPACARHTQTRPIHNMKAA